MIARLACVTTLLVAAAPAQQRVEFERDVLPILRERCFDCHGAPRPDAAGAIRKPKGELRLDGVDWIRRGGAGGSVLEPGAPDDSELWLRTTLPPDDPDVMPSKGDPLTAEQTALLRRWIAEGASFGAWTGAVATAAPADADVAAPALPPRLAALAALAEGLTPVSDADRARAAGAHGRIRGALGDDLRLVTVRYPAHQADVDDDVVALLAPLRDHVAVLDLGRTAVTDAALRKLARMPNLVRLDLDRTAVTAAGLRELAGLPHLATLNLFGTKLGARAVETLASLESLRTVYLWQSDLSDAALGRLRGLRPELRVVGAPELPAAESAEPPPPRRGR